MSELYDITIVGGGPVGLFAAFYAHLRKPRLKSLIPCLNRADSQPFSIQRRRFWMYRALPI